MLAMPELPEVETMRRGIAPILGLCVADVQAVRGRRRPIQIAPGPLVMRRRLVGQTVREIDRAGKRVVVWFTGDWALVLEPRMTGLVLLTDPPSQEHLRFHLRLAPHPAPKSPRRSGAAATSSAAASDQRDLWFWDRRGLGSVRLLSKQQFERVFDLEKLGPDALSITAVELQARLGASRRAVKVALLDQRAVAGVGNLYAAEILHVARISPLVECNRLRGGQWSAIQAAMQTVLREAIEFEGSTLGDGTYRTALNRQGRYQNHHRVYDREGQRCGRCERGVVRRIVQAQRATFYCPRCQRKT